VKRANFVTAFLTAALTALGLSAGPAIAQPAVKAATTSASAGAQDDLARFVEANVGAALASLSAAQQGSEARAQRFATLMGQFSDVSAISTHVLGRYAAGLNANPALRRDWEAAFTAFAFANYEDQLDRFRGYSVRATGVTFNQPGRDALVRTEMLAPGASRPTIVQWRMLNRGAGWKVYDVLVNLRGNDLWLGQRQKRRFEAELDKTRGDISALITVVRQETATIRARMGARR
jgi:ABC-type transporter MlaC component